MLASMATVGEYFLKKFSLIWFIPLLLTVATMSCVGTEDTQSGGGIWVDDAESGADSNTAPTVTNVIPPMQMARMGRVKSLVFKWFFPKL